MKSYHRYLNDSSGNRTRVTAVKGRCLNRLTMEPSFDFCSAKHRIILSSFFLAYLTACDCIASAITQNFLWTVFPSSLFASLMRCDSPSWARTNNPSVNSRVLYH